MVFWMEQCFTDTQDDSKLGQVGCCHCDRSREPGCCLRFWSGFFSSPCGAGMCLTGNYDGPGSRAFKLQLCLFFLVLLPELLYRSLHLVILLCNPLPPQAKVSYIAFDEQVKYEFSHSYSDDVLPLIIVHVVVDILTFVAWITSVVHLLMWEPKTYMSRNSAVVGPPTTV
ncbi:unnamed protein product [Amoebophrya sp. A120]|nr:unnamed protein product [Amoebophrya sp. A120]|eukprot:GSA120T00000603001.1